MHICHSNGASLWSLIKRGGVSSHFHMSHTVPLPAVDGPLHHETNTSRHANYSVHSQGLKFSQENSYPHLGHDLSPHLISCPAWHCFGFAVFDDTFWAVQNIYLIFNFFSLFHIFVFYPVKNIQYFLRFFSILTKYCIILLKSFYSFHSFKILSDYIFTIKIILRFDRFRSPSHYLIML